MTNRERQIRMAVSPPAQNDKAGMCKDEPIAPGSEATVKAQETQQSSKRKESQKEDLEAEQVSIAPSVTETPAKKTKAPNSRQKTLPAAYEECDVKDLVQLIGEMLLDLIQINDKIPLQEDALTRFHSRVPPGISVMDYLQRLATHANLSPPILLSMVYYIDKLFASKGLSDTFWTNSTYARVGGISVRELGLLELELLRRVDWRIVPKPEILIEYYRSLVDRSKEFSLASDGTTGMAAEGPLPNGG